MLYFSKELLMKAPYKRNEVLGEYTVPGTYTLDVKASGVYEIEAVSGGGSGESAYWFDNWYTAGNGATGCYYKNTFSIAKGSYTVTIGAGGVYAGGHSSVAGGSTSFGDILSLTGGAGWNMNLVVHAVYPLNNTPGQLSYANNTVGTATYAEGYAGSGSTDNPGKQSFPQKLGPQNNYGLGNYGQGGWGTTGGGCGSGTGGYLKITYKGR